uniref:Uncharacterized protein n=1 Tax=Molossus molossus TaxID=27622 RepID=A0A7J8CS18_MOLMO|nr:hypothetical protein HJG59_009825 [Molossus molossus]
MARARPHGPPGLHLPAPGVETTRPRVCWERRPSCDIVTVLQTDAQRTELQATFVLKAGRIVGGMSPDRHFYRERGILLFSGECPRRAGVLISPFVSRTGSCHGPLPSAPQATSCLIVTSPPSRPSDWQHPAEGLPSWGVTSRLLGSGAGLSEGHWWCLRLMSPHTTSCGAGPFSCIPALLSPATGDNR